MNNQSGFPTPTFTPAEPYTNYQSPNLINSLVNPNNHRIGLATLGGFIPPDNVSTGNSWKLIRVGGDKSSNIFPPPINDIKWQGFYTKEVSGYSRKLYWVCGYGLLPDSHNSNGMMLLFQWWHTEPVTITDYRMISSEDWDNANIYVTSLDRLEDIFIKTQLTAFNGTHSTTSSNPAPKQQWKDVIELNEPTVIDKDESNDSTSDE